MNTLVLDAMRLAERAHRTRPEGPHTRKAPDGEDRPAYFIHLAEVGWMLQDAGLDPETVAAGYLHDIIEDCGYLNARDIAINAVFFQVFQHGDAQLLSRAWLIDPSETQANVASTTKGKGEKEPWNGEYYVSFGDASSRSWEDARRYGFISAGGGSWYSQTLKLLSPGDRIWVKIPKTGYVGVGRVTETVLPVKEFTIQTPEGERPALDVLKHADKYKLVADDPEKAEYFVRVVWLDTVPEAQAVYEVGLFGNQNSVCQPLTPTWRHTVERLKTYFTKWDDRAV